MSKIGVLSNEFISWTTSNLPVYKQYIDAPSNTSADPVPYLFLTILFTTLVFIVESYLDHRQLSRFSGPSCVLPKELVDFVNAATFDKSVAYGKDKFAFKIIEVNEQIILFSLLKVQFFARVRILSSKEFSLYPWAICLTFGTTLQSPRLT